jgi:hypothetical protein
VFEFGTRFGPRDPILAGDDWDRQGIGDDRRKGLDFAAERGAATFMAFGAPGTPPQ